jgi:hypothetical protein
MTRVIIADRVLVDGHIASKGDHATGAKSSLSGLLDHCTLAAP